MAAVTMKELSSLMFMTLKGGLDRCFVLGAAKGRMNNALEVLENERRRASSRELTTGREGRYHLTTTHYRSYAPSRASHSALYNALRFFQNS